MTDMARFIELYRSFGVELQAEPADKYDLQSDPNIGFTITIGEETPKLNKGYGGFYSTVFFDRQEKFMYQGFWE